MILCQGSRCDRHVGTGVYITSAQTWGNTLRTAIEGMGLWWEAEGHMLRHATGMTEKPKKVCLNWPGAKGMRTASHIATSPPSPQITHEYSHWLPDSSSCMSSSPGDCSVSTTGSSPQMVISSVWPARTISCAPRYHGNDQAKLASHAQHRSASVTYRRVTPHNAGGGCPFVVRLFPAQEVDKVRPRTWKTSTVEFGF